MSFVEKFLNKFIIYLLIRCHKKYSLGYFMSVGASADLII